MQRRRPPDHSTRQKQLLFLTVVCCAGTVGSLVDAIYFCYLFVLFLSLKIILYMCVCIFAFLLSVMSTLVIYFGFVPSLSLSVRDAHVRVIMLKGVKVYDRARGSRWLFTGQRCREEGRNHPLLQTWKTIISVGRASARSNNSLCRRTGHTHTQHRTLRDNDNSLHRFVKCLKTSYNMKKRNHFDSCCCWPASKHVWRPARFSSTAITSSSSRQPNGRKGNESKSKTSWPWSCTQFGEKHGR